MKDILNWLIDNWEDCLGLSLLLWELIVSLKPTTKNLSLFDLVFKVIRVILPNIRKKLTTDVVVDFTAKGKPVNEVPVRQDRHVVKMVLILFMLSFGLSAIAQTNTVFKAGVSINADSTTVRANTVNYQNLYGTNDVGVLYYNNESNKWRVFAAGSWSDLGGGGSGGLSDALTFNQTFIGNASNVATGLTLPFVMPENYGAVGNGIADDATALQNAINSGLPVYLSEKTYLTSSTLAVPVNTFIFGGGVNSIIKTTANVSILRLDSINCSLANFTLLGNDVGTSQNGISASGNSLITKHRYGNSIINMTFKDLGGSGIYATNIIGKGSSKHQGGFYVTNCRFESNNIGINWDIQAEYSLVSNSSINSNVIGVRMIGGNNSFSNVNIADNTTGLSMLSGANDGHCVMSGSKINHNTTGLSVIGVSLGYLFQGTMFYSNPITISSSSFIKFDACDFSGLNITSSSAVSLLFQNSRFRTTPTFTVTGNNPLFFNNFWETGVYPTIMTNTIHGKMVLQSTSILPGLNIGSVAGDPSTVANGDGWYNSTSNSLRFRLNSATLTMAGANSADVVTNRIPFYAGSDGRMGSTSALTSTATVTTVPRLVTTASATLSPLNVGSLAGDPSIPINGDLNYNSSTNELKARINGAWVVLGAGGGITNTAAANELGKSDGTNILPSGFFSTASGDLIMGDAASGVTTHTLTTNGSGSNIGLVIDTKGSGNITVNDNATWNNKSVGITQTGTDTRTSLQGASIQFANSSAGNLTDALITGATGISGRTTGDQLTVTGGNGYNSGATNGGDLTLKSGTPNSSGVNGHLILETGSTTGTLKLNSGANEQCGLATLVGGTVVVNNTKITANSYVFLTHRTLGGTVGTLTYTVSAGTSFTITSTSGTDTSTVNWFIVEPN